MAVAPTPSRRVDHRARVIPWFYGRRGVIDMIIETGRGSHVFPA